MASQDGLPIICVAVCVAVLKSILYSLVQLI